MKKDYSSEKSRNNGFFCGPSKPNSDNIVPKLRILLCN